MTLQDIRKFPTTVCHDVPNGFRIHESCLRSFHILEKAKSLMSKRTPHEVILEVIFDLENAPKSDLNGADGSEEILRK